MDSFVYNTPTVKELALKYCDLCGVSRVQKHGGLCNLAILPEGLAYLENSKEIRRDIKLWHKEAQSVLMCAFYYGANPKTITAEEWRKLKTLRRGRYVKDLSQELNLKSEDKIKIASYTAFTDYHITIKENLKLILNEIKNIYPAAQGKIFVDSSPVAEKFYAVKCGLGKIGKNSLLYNEDFGSFILLGGISLNAGFSEYAKEPDSYLLDECKTCSLCEKACPCGAVNDFSIDQSKCLAYYNTQHKGALPNGVNRLLKIYADGCDECALTCPLNLKIKRTPKFFKYLI